MFYSEELVEEVRQRNDIVSIISSYIKLQKKGNSYVGLCPFHNEKSPSFSVHASRQMYHCFGCGVGGNVFTFIMEYENHTFLEALRYLANRSGVSLPEGEYSEEEKKQTDLRNRLLEVNKMAAKYFYYQLKTEQGKEAHAYLKKRNLSEETIQKFGLGYANKYRDDLYTYLRKSGYTDELLKQSGLITMEEARGVYDKFWNRVIFPIMDINNKVIGFGGRVMGEGKPKYLNSPETKVFDKSHNLYGLNLARLSRKRQILLCEGYMDVIALHQEGFSNAVASLGTSFTGVQANILKRYAEEICITYDSDGAGIQAALRAIPILKEAGLLVKVIDLRPCKDPDEFIKEKGAEAFSEQIEKAWNSFYFEIEMLERKYDLNDPEQKTRFFNEIAKKLLVFTEELERNNYIEAIAKKYQIDFENLRKLVNKYGSQIIVGNDYENGSRENYNQKKKKVENGMIKSQKILLTWLVEDIHLFEKVKNVLSPMDFKEEPYHQVSLMLFAQYEKEKVVNPAKIISYFESKEEQNEVASLFSTPLRVEMNQMEKEKAFNETIIRIKKHSLDIASKYATNFNELQDIIKQQTDLQKLHISL